VKGFRSVVTKRPNVQGSEKWRVKCSEVRWIKVRCNEVEWSEVKWSGVEWSGVKWNEVKWSEVKWSEVKWSAVKWSEVKWSEVMILGEMCILPSVYFYVSVCMFCAVYWVIIQINQPTRCINLSPLLPFV